MVDKQQDVKNFNGQLVEGILSAEFSRPVHTTDKDDLPLMDREKGFCQDFMFPLSAGVLEVDGEKNVLRKHFQIPVVKRMCNIDQCLPPELRTAPTEPPTTTQPPLPSSTTPRPTVTNEIVETIAPRVFPVTPQVPFTNNFVQPEQPSRFTQVIPQSLFTNGILEQEATRLIPAPTRPPLQNPQFETVVTFLPGYLP